MLFFLIHIQIRVDYPPFLCALCQSLFHCQVQCQVQCLLVYEVLRRRISVLARSAGGERYVQLHV